MYDMVSRKRCSHAVACCAAVRARVCQLLKTAAVFIRSGNLTVLSGAGGVLREECRTAPEAPLPVLRLPTWQPVGTVAAAPCTCTELCQMLGYAFDLSPP